MDIETFCPLPRFCEMVLGGDDQLSAILGNYDVSEADPSAAVRTIPLSARRLGSHIFAA
jgi:hypothetical protein